MVGMKGGDDAFQRIVEEHGAHTDADVELEAVGIREECFVVTDRLAFVVEHSPTTAHPAWGDAFRGHHGQAILSDDDVAVGITLRRRSELGLDLLLYLATKAV